MWFMQKPVNCKPKQQSMYLILVWFFIGVKTGGLGQLGQCWFTRLKAKKGSVLVTYL